MKFSNQLFLEKITLSILLKKPEFYHEVKNLISAADYVGNDANANIFISLSQKIINDEPFDTKLLAVQLEKLNLGLVEIDIADYIDSLIAIEVAEKAYKSFFEELCDNRSKRVFSNSINKIQNLIKGSGEQTFFQIVAASNKIYRAAIQNYSPRIEKKPQLGKIEIVYSDEKGFKRNVLNKVAADTIIIDVENFNIASPHYYDFEFSVEKILKIIQMGGENFIINLFNQEQTKELISVLAKIIEKKEIQIKILCGEEIKDYLIWREASSIMKYTDKGMEQIK